MNKIEKKERMKNHYINRALIAFAGFLVAMTLFYSPLLGAIMVGLSEVTTVGFADCRTWSEEQPLMVCTGVPAFLHGKGGTQFGDTFVTSKLRSDIDDDMISHESIHKEQQRKYGIMFIPLYFTQDVIYGCENNFEEEASFRDGGYSHCVGKEQYRH